LQEQLGGWAEQGMKLVKMKIGRDPAADPLRVQAARRAVGDRAQLFVDANGAYSRTQALALAYLSPPTTCAGSRSRSAPTISTACA